MVNYVAIADACDAAGYPDYETAFAAMSVATEQVAKDVDTRMINERTIYALLGSASGEALLTGIEALPVETLPARAKAWFAPGAGGIDVLDAAVPAILAGMVAGAVITQAQADTVTAYGYNTVLKWPGLTIEHVKKAMAKRAGGEL